MRDFTLKYLKKLYESLLRNNYTITNVADFLQNKYSKKVCLLRHDVDRGLQSALKLARIEKELNISASYYFRYPQTFNKNVIKEIYSLNHETGYHYEVLAKTKGDYEKAITLFKKELAEFRKTTAIKTICAHGSPLSKWDNRKIWDKYNFTEFGIIGEAYSSINFNEVLYLADTGRSWNPSVGNVRDKVKSEFAYVFNNTYELILAINKKTLPDKIMLNIHPNRWTDNIFAWGVELIGQNIKNFIKKIIHYE